MSNPEHQISELLSSLPSVVPTSYYHKQLDIIFISRSTRDEKIEKPVFRWLTMEKDLNTGKWLGFQVHHTGWLAEHFFLNPVKTSRFLASIC